MRGADNSPCDERGVVLFEVLVALAITLIALDLFYGSITQALRLAHTTAAAEAAISRAQSHLAAINNAVLVPAVQSGDDGDGYRWSSQVTLAGTAPAPGKARSGPWAYGTALYMVSITISWREGRSERHFVLSSARLGPARRTAP